AQAEQGYPLHDEPPVPVYFGVAVVALAFNSNWVTPAGGWKTKSLSGGLIKKSQQESSAMKIGRPGSERIVTTKRRGTDSPTYSPPTLEGYLIDVTQPRTRLTFSHHRSL